MYAYHTDSNGYYSKSGNEKGVQKWHGKLHGWCKTDQDGQYKMITIKPAPYPGDNIPAHIHVAVKLPNGKMHWLNDFVFKDDPLVNEHYLSGLSGVGGTGVVEVQKNPISIWMGTRDMILAD